MEEFFAPENLSVDVANGAVRAKVDLVTETKESIEIRCSAGEDHNFIIFVEDMDDEGNMDCKWRGVESGRHGSMLLTVSENCPEVFDGLASSLGPEEEESEDTPRETHWRLIMKHPILESEDELSEEELTELGIASVCVP